MARSNIHSFSSGTSGTGSDAAACDSIFSAIADSDLNRIKTEFSKPFSGGVPLINRSSTRDKYGNTPLHAAINMADPDIIKELINLGCDLSMKNKRGQTCYDLLSRNGTGQTIEHLSTRHLKTIDSCRAETRSRTLEIQALQTEVKGLEESNTRQAYEIQTLKIDLIGKRKQIDDLETQCGNLRRAAKKPKA
jgi:ankyrin repeat protein